jgi:hypothetical protein
VLLLSLPSVKAPVGLVAWTTTELAAVVDAVRLPDIGSVKAGADEMLIQCSALAR